MKTVPCTITPLSGDRPILQLQCQQCGHCHQYAGQIDDPVAVSLALLDLSLRCPQLEHNRYEPAPAPERTVPA